MVAEAERGSDGGVAGGYAWTVCLILTLAQALAFVDRQVLALLVEPIKRDLHISDSAIGLLYGPSFALFYSFVTLPIAWLADRSNRRNIVAGAVAVWSLMAAACGAAQTFPLLLLARLGVGAGEAGLSPSAQSMLADYFPGPKLGAAFGVFGLGIPLGGGLALISGGMLLKAAPEIARGMAPWRFVMIVVGLAGLLVALLFAAVREPARRGGRALRSDIGAVLGHLSQHPLTYVGLMGALSLMVFVSIAGSAWTPAFFARRFGWDGARLGGPYGILLLVCGGAGALSGGFLASYLRRRGVGRANLKAALTGFSLVTPLAIGFPFAPDPHVALGLIAALAFAAAMPSGGGYAALQEITPPRMRAQVTALNVLMVNLLGASLGPLLVGVVTDSLLHDPSRVGQAIALSALVGCPLTIGGFLLAMRGYDRAAEAAAV